MEIHCAVKCPVVSEAVKDATPTSKLNMAIAAIESEKIGLREAARRFGVDHSSISKRMKKNGDVVNGHHHTTQESKPARTKPTDEERQEWWRLHTEEGLTTNAIHKKTGRNRETITKEIKRREEAKARPTRSPAPTPPASAPKPTAVPAPTPSVPSAGSSAAIPERWADHPLLDGWNGNLNELGQKIYKREVASSRSRVKIAEQMAQYKLELEKTMNAASKSHRVKAGALLEADVRMVEARLQEEGRPGIMETLEAVRHEAERIHKFATRSLEILQLVKPNY